MKNPERKKYVYWMLAGFGGISMSVIFFFLLYRLQSVEETLQQIVDILMPFVYGGVIAYLLRPMCNWYSAGFHNMLKNKKGRLAEGLAITCSMLTGLLVVYLLIIMIAPQLYFVFWQTVNYLRNPLTISSSASFSVSPSVISLISCSPAIFPIAAS